MWWVIASWVERWSKMEQKVDALETRISDLVERVKRIEEASKKGWW